MNFPTGNNATNNHGKTRQCFTIYCERQCFTIYIVTLYCILSSTDVAIIIYSIHILITVSSKIF